MEIEDPNSVDYTKIQAFFKEVDYIIYSPLEKPPIASISIQTTEIGWVPQRRRDLPPKGVRKWQVLCGSAERVASTGAASGGGVGVEVPGREGL